MVPSGIIGPLQLIERVGNCGFVDLWTAVATSPPPLERVMLPWSEAPLQKTTATPTHLVRITNEKGESSSSRSAPMGADTRALLAAHGPLFHGGLGQRLGFTAIPARSSTSLLSFTATRSPLAICRLFSTVAEQLGRGWREVVSQERLPMLIGLTPSCVRVVDGAALVVGFGVCEVYDGYFPVDDDGHPTAAPELFGRYRLKPPPTLAISLFSFGAVLYRALTGAPLIELTPERVQGGCVIPSVMTSLQAYAGPSEERLASLPAPIAGLVRSLVAVDPAQRPTSFGMLVDRLRFMGADLDDDEPVPPG